MSSLNILYRDNYVVCRLLILSLLSLAFGKLSDYNTKTASYIKKGLGNQNTVNVFFSDHMLAESIHYQRKLLEETSAKNNLISYNIDSNNIKSSKGTSMLKDSYLCCTNYNDITTTISLFDSFTIESHITYSSITDGLACFLSYLNVDNYNSLVRSSITFLVIEPIPHLLKFDSSIHKLHSLSYFSGDFVSSVRHPIISDIQSNKSMFLSVVLRKDTLKHSSKELVKKWFNHLRGINTKVIGEAFKNVYWHNSVNDFDLNKPKKTRSLKIKNKGDDVLTKKVSIPAYMWKNEKLMNNNNHVDFKEVNGLMIKDLHNQIKNKWAVWKDIIINLSLDQKLFSDACGVEALISNVKYRHRNVYLKLPKEMLTFVSFNSTKTTTNKRKLFEMEYNEADISAACFSFFVSMIISDNAVVKAAVSQYPHLLNNIARQIVQGGEKGPEPFTDLGLTGSGMVVGVSDTGIDENSCYFKDRVNGKVPRSEDGSVIDFKFRKVIQYVNFSGSSGDYDGGHGSHVVGTLAGHCDYQSDSSNQAMNVFKGMASDAKIAFFDIGVNDADQDLAIPFQIADVIFPPAHKAGARIHSNSWGGGYWYDAFCVEVDEYLYNNEDFTAFFAGGNDGSNGPETVLSPGLSKNVIAVGCSENEHSNSFNKNFIASFSSHGPSNDGRIKPDIITPGFSLTSVKAHSEKSPSDTCETTSKAGTSMATPVAAGNAILVRQYFMDPKFWKSFCNPTYKMCKVGAFPPKGSLIKALMLHSGEQMSLYNGAGTVTGRVGLGDTPDIFQGYGRVNLKNILPTQKENSPFSLFVDEGSLLQLTEQQYNIEVHSNSIPLKVTLSWYDPPNEVFVAKCLLHDLDLVIVDPRGYVFFGNSHNSDGNPNIGSSRDEVNNNEQVHVNSPVVGTWTVRVQAKALTESKYQNFSLVITTNGVITSNNILIPLSPTLLKQCQVGSGLGSIIPKLDVDVSLYSRVMGDGWKASDSYTLTDASSNVLYNGYFNERHLYYKVDSPCLPAGCYSASLHLNGGSQSTRGTQMSIAECGIYLSPLAPTESFCIDQPIPYPNNVNSESVEYFPKGSCSSVCQRSNHIEMPLLLFEGEGAGWSGSYYFILPLNTILEKTLPLQMSTVATGNLEWGFEKIDNVCLPVKSQCYRLQLSYPKDTEEFPEIAFEDSYFIDDSTGTRIIHRDKMCPFEVNITVSMAQFCVEDNLEMSYVEFFIETKTIPDFGQLTEDWQSLIVIQTNTIKIGVCSLNVSLISHNSKSPTPIPSLQLTDNPISANTPSQYPIVSLSPEPLPTSLPIMGNNPTIKPTKQLQPTTEPNAAGNYLGGDVDMFFNNHSFACFKDCPSLFITSDGSQICDFLIETYFLCSSFNIAAGLCKKPDCASTCSARDWCYFGSLAVINCPVTSYQWVWRGYTQFSKRINDECENSFRKKKSSTSVSSQNSTIVTPPESNPDYSTSTKVVIVGVFLFLIFLTILACVQYSWRNNISQETISNNSSDSNNNTVKNAIHDSDNSNNSNINSKSFSNSIKKMIRGGNKNGDSSSQYEMVPTISLKDAFTIEGEDDDEEAGFGDDEDEEN